MSDEESDGGAKKNKISAMPPNKIRFTDLPDKLVEKAIRCKLYHTIWLIILVTAKANQGVRLDKDVASAIHKELNTDPDLLDECAGWHVIVGKSYASAITYQTKNVLFFDLLGDVHKTFLIFKTQWSINLKTASFEFKIYAALKYTHEH